MQISNETIKRLHQHFIADITKQDVNILDRAIMIKNYLEENRLSLRGFSRLYKIPLTTLHDWLLPLKLSKEKQEIIQKDSIRIADVYSMLEKSRFKKRRLPQTESERVIEECIKNLTPLIYDITPNERIITLLNELKNVVNRIMFHLEQKMRRR